MLLQQYLKRCLPSITKQLRLLLRHCFLIYPSAPESKLGKYYFCSEGDVTEYQRKIDKESAEVNNSKLYCKESVDSEGNDAESIKREPENFTELRKRLNKSDWTYQKVTKNKVHGWFFVRPGFNPNDPEMCLEKNIPVWRMMLFSFKNMVAKNLQ